MSHIPASVMPHAGPDHDEEPKAKLPVRSTPPARSSGGDWSLAAVAVGGALALGVVAIAVPLLRPKPAPKRKGKRKARG